MGNMTPRKYLWVAWALHAALVQTYSILAAVTAKRLLPVFRAQKFGGSLRIVLRNLQAVLSASFLLVNLMTWTTFAIILGKSIMRKGFGTAPGLLVGCAIGACFVTWLALFFSAALMQSGYLLVADLLSDDDSQLFQACFALGYTAGTVYLLFSAALFALRGVMTPTSAQAQEEALQLREREQKRGFFSRGRAAPEPPPPPPPPAASPAMRNPIAGLMGRGGGASAAAPAPVAAAPAAPAPAAAPAAAGGGGALSSNPWA